MLLSRPTSASLKNPFRNEALSRQNPLPGAMLRPQSPP
jgi:hypothetical protein